MIEGTKQLFEFPATLSVAGSDLIYSANVTTGIEQRSTVKQLQTYILAGIALSNNPDAGTLTGTETMPVSRGSGLLQTTTGGMARLILGSFAPQRQSIPVLTAGQAAYVTQGYTAGLVNVFIMGIRISPSGYQALDGVNLTITDPSVLATLVPGMTVDLDASLSIAVANVATVASVQALDPANQPAIGTLTGGELISTRQGGGLFQTSLTKLATFVNGLINPTALPAAGVLTGTELAGVSQSGSLVTSTLASIGAYANSLVAPATLPAAAALTGTELAAVSQGGSLVKSALSAIATYVNNLINPPNLPASATLTGTELFGLSQAGSLARSTLTSLTTFILSQQPPGSLLTDTGTANTYSAVNPAPLTTGTWIMGVVQQITVGHTNTGASTYAPDGLTALPILGESFLPLVGNEMLAGGIARLMRMTVTGVNGGNPFCALVDCTGAPKQTATATAVSHSATLGQVQNAAGRTGVDTGTANTYVVALTPAITAVIPWVPFWFQVNVSNTGASTLNATGTAYPLVGAAHTALQGGEMFAKGNALVNGNTALFDGGGAGVITITRLEMNDNECLPAVLASFPINFNLATITRAEALRNKLNGAGDRTAPTNIGYATLGNNTALFFTDGDYSGKRWNQGGGTIAQGATSSSAITHGCATIDGQAQQPKTMELQVNVALGATTPALLQATQIFSTTFTAMTSTAAPSGGLAFVWRMAPVVQCYVNGTLAS